MILWFAVLAPIIVAEIFRSPMIDYRVVTLGALLPVLEVFLGHAFVLHTVLGAASILGVVVIATQRRRLSRRRLLGLPIGILFHLVLDGGWTRADLFWWPAFGWGFGSRQIPEADHSLGLILAMELAGMVAGVWAWGRYQLDDPQNRRLLISTGQLSRSVLS